MDNGYELCGQCGHLKMQHGFPMNQACGHSKCDCQKYIAIGVIGREDEFGFCKKHDLHFMDNQECYKCMKEKLKRAIDTLENLRDCIHVNYCEGVCHSGLCMKIRGTLEAIK